MKYVHTKCGGAVDPKSRKCLKCKKHWGFLNWWFNLTDIRLTREPGDYKRQLTKQEELQTVERLIRERVPGGFAVVNIARIFKYPRQKWARALIVLCIVGGIIYLLVRVVI